MVAPLIRFLQPMSRRGLPQVDLDKLFRLRSRMDYEQGIPVNPSNRPVAPLETLYPREFSLPGDSQAFRVLGNQSTSRRPVPGFSPEQIRQEPFVRPPRSPDSPTPLTRRDTPFVEPPLRQRNAESFDPREIIVPTSVKQADGTVRVVPETIIYRPLNPEEVADVARFVSEDPVAAVFQTIDLFENTKNVEDFVRVLQISNLVRRGTGNDRKVIGTMLDTVMTRRARALNVSEDVVDPVLYTNSKDMPDVIAARVNPTKAQIEAKYTDSDRLRTDTAKVIRNARKMEELDTIDTLNNGGLVGRAVAKGEITSADAAYLLNQANYRRVFLLKKSGVLGDSVKNNVRAQGGTRGIDMIPNMSEFSEARKVQIYKTAIHTSETPEEALQVYAMARSDIRSVTFLDELDEVATIRTNRTIDLEGVEATRPTQRFSSTIDEDAITSANRAQTDFDAARMEASRPENLGDTVTEFKRDAKGKILLDEDGNKIVDETFEMFGKGKATVIDRSLLSMPPARPVKRSALDMEPSPRTGYIERTVYNAQNSDATIAVARDFDSPGEILTANAARGLTGVQIDSQGKARAFKALAGQPRPGRETPIFQINHGDSGYRNSVDDIVTSLNSLSDSRKGQPLTVNFAGNSLNSIVGNKKPAAEIVKAQAEANAYARHVLDAIMDHPQRKFEVGLARSGGQHGYDVAFINAARDHGIPVAVRYPSGQYGGVMMSNYIDDSLKPVFLKMKDYIKFANGDLMSLFK